MHEESSLPKCNALSLDQLLSTFGISWMFSLSRVNQSKNNISIEHAVSLCNENQLDVLIIFNLFVNQPLHVSGMFNAHHREVCTVYIQQLVRVIY
jgi:hypothetical protein